MLVSHALHFLRDSSRHRPGESRLIFVLCTFFLTTEADDPTLTPAAATADLVTVDTLISASVNASLAAQTVEISERALFFVFCVKCQQTTEKHY